jgi:hypothetical protein
MASIGGRNVATMKGQIQPAHEELEEFARPGTDGYTVRLLGRRAQNSTIETFVDLSSKLGISTELVAYKAMVGTFVSVVDSKGTVWNRVLVKAVDPVDSGAIGLGVGGLCGTGAGGFLRCRWTLRT